MALLQGPQLLATSHCHDDPAPGLLLVLWTFQQLHGTLGETRVPPFSLLSSHFTGHGRHPEVASCPHWSSFYLLKWTKQPPGRKVWRTDLCSRADLFEAKMCFTRRARSRVQIKPKPARADLCCEKYERLELFGAARTLERAGKKPLWRKELCLNEKCSYNKSKILCIMCWAFVYIRVIECIHASAWGQLVFVLYSLYWFVSVSCIQHSQAAQSDSNTERCFRKWYLASRSGLEKRQKKRAVAVNTSTCISWRAQR